MTKGLSVLTATQHHNSILTNSQDWLKLIENRDYDQGLSLYQQEYADILDYAGSPINLPEFIEYCAINQHHDQALSLIAGIQRGQAEINKKENNQLSLLSFIIKSTSGRFTELDIPILANNLLLSASASSQNLRELFVESICAFATNELAHGRRRSAHKLLLQIKPEIGKLSPSRKYVIESLLKISSCSNAHRIKVKIQERMGKISNVLYHKDYACAVDSAVFYNKDRIVSISGWYIGAHANSFNIGIVKHPNVYTLHTPLVQRYVREDLSGIEQRYGVAQGSLSGFTCTLVLDNNTEPPKEWGDSALAKVLISTDSSLTYLLCSKTHQELGLADTRKLVNQLISNDIKLSNYVAAKNLKSAWKDQIKTLSHQEATHHVFGEKALQPDVSIIVPLYGRLDFMEFQIHWFFYSQKLRKTRSYSYQLIYCLDNPDQTDDLMSLAKKCSLLYQIPFEIVINPANLGFAGSNNLAARYATSELLLLLNSDIIPRDYDSVDQLISCYHSMPSNKGALGAKLLYPSRDIQHVGMTFFKDSSLPGLLSNCWLNEHPHKYINDVSNPSLQTGIIEMEAATAACLLISKELFNQLGGFRLDYICGDFEDSDMCLRIRSLGRSIMVCLDAVFFHLERQSMVLQSGQNQEALKLVAFNAYTHHEFHGSTIERLKSMLISSAPMQNHAKGAQL